MNKNELKSYLQKNKIPEYLYSLEGGMDEDKICLAEVHGIWIVYRVEKGKMWNEHKFDSEEIACKYFFDEINFLLDIIKRKSQK